MAPIYLVTLVHTATHACFTGSKVVIALLAFGVATLNQFIERSTDALMKRTASRPLPMGTLTSRLARGREALQATLS